jgi:hypothetical protein
MMIALHMTFVPRPQDQKRRVSFIDGHRINVAAWGSKSTDDSS